MVVMLSIIILPRVTAMALHRAVDQESRASSRTFTQCRVVRCTVFPMLMRLGGLFVVEVHAADTFRFTFPQINNKLQLWSRISTVWLFL